MRRITEEQQRKNVAMAELAVRLHEYQAEHDLTEPEMFMALTSWMQGMPKLYCIRYADGHLGEERTWESALELIYNGRVWRRRGGPDLMIAVRVEEA